MSKSKRIPKQELKTAAAPAQQTSPSFPFFWIGIGLLLIACIARLRLLDIPFERDEGVFAYIGQALWGGERLYTDLYDNKLPGLYLVYGLFATVFGVQPWGIHLGAFLWHLVTLAVFFLWLREVLGRDLALAGTGLFALYAASGEVLGFAAHATQLCMLPALLGLWALWRGTIQGRASQAGWIFLAGLGAGLAIWVKQQALFYPVFGVLFLGWWFWGRERNTSGSRATGLTGLYVLGVALPVGLSAAWFAVQGRFDDFWFWTVEISTGERSQAQGGGWFFFNFYFPKVIFNWWWVWLSAFIGMYVALRQKESVNLRVVAWLLPLSLWGVSLGGAFYPHYFVLSLPWLAVCAVLGLEFLVREYRTAGRPMAAVVVLWPVLAGSGYWFWQSQRAILWRAYDNNCFSEMREIGAELKKRSAVTDSIAVVGSEPEVFLYADRRSALSHLFFQGVVQKHARYAQFQQQTREELLGRKPRFVVFPGVQYEYLKNDPLMKEIVVWLQKEYHPVCVADDISEKQSKITWDPTPEQAIPKTLHWAMVFERN